MPHSLRAKIKGLRYKGVITDKDCDRLCKALDNENVLDKIRAEIEQTAKDYDKFADYRRVRGLWIVLDIIDKYKGESEDKCKNCKYYRNPDYTRCHECEAEREDKE